MLAIGHSSTLLALLAAQAGSSHVTAIERCALSYRAGKLLLDANQHKVCGTLELELCVASSKYVA